MIGVGNIVADVAHHVELVAQGLALLLGGTLLCHGLTGDSHHVGHGVGTLITGNVLIDITQLSLDDGQTLLDELVGGDADLVAVLDPLLAIDADDGAQDVLGTRDGVIDTPDVDNALGLLLLRGGNLGTIDLGCGGVAGTVDQDVAMQVLLII